MSCLIIGKINQHWSLTRGFVANEAIQSCRLLCHSLHRSTSRHAPGSGKDVVRGGYEGQRAPACSWWRW